MGFDNRDYYKEPQSGNPFGGRLGKHSMVTWLIGINAAVFMLDMVLSGSTRANAAGLTKWGAFSYDEAIKGFQVWRFFTFQFLHGGFLHVFFNMLALYFFAPTLEKWWGSKRFLAFYLICGTSAAAFYLLLSLIPGLIPGGTYGYLVGASGGVFGVLVGAAIIAPDRTVMLLFPPIPMKMKTMVFIFLGLAVLSVLVGGQNAGGEAAHLGGALFGFLLMMRPSVLNFADRFSPSAIQENVNEGRFAKKLKQREDDEKELDRLLEKVSAQGLHSLNEKEKKKLNQLSEKKRQED